MKIGFYIKKYFKYISIIVFLSFIKAALSFINPMLIKKILDLVPFSTKPLINDKIFTYFFLFFAALLGSYITDFTLSKIKLVFSFVFKTCEQKDLYEKLMKIKYESFCANGATYYVYRISQLINDLFMLLSSYLSSLLVALFIIVVSLFFLFKGSPVLFIVGMILLPANYLGYKRINLKLLEKSKKLQEVSAANSNEIINFISNFETIKQYLNFANFLGFLTRNFKNIEVAHNDINLYAQKTSLLLGFVIDFLKNFALIFLIYLFYSHSITFSELIFLNMIFAVYMSGLTELNRININLRDLKVGINFVNEEIINKEEKNSGDLELIQVQRIDISIKNFRYKNKTVLENINLSLETGKKYGIAGNSGCGKSTLAKLLVNLYESDGIYVNNENINRYPLKKLRDKIFLLPHTPQVFPLSIKDNILIGANENEQKKYEEVIRMAFLKDIAYRHDFEKTVISSGISLSSGEKQAICAARIFIKNPDVVIFDEATSAMDSKLEDLFVKELDEKFFSKDKIIIFISHRLSTIKKCDKIILMGNKTVEAIFNSYEEAALNPRFIKLYESQM